jgi:hypothetical protein
MRLIRAAQAIESGSEDAVTMGRVIGADKETASAAAATACARTRAPLGGATRDRRRAERRGAESHLLDRRSIAAGGDDPEIEAAVYFCCVEAQNAAKHAGDACVTVRLWRHTGTLSFEVIDTGRRLR